MNNKHIIFDFNGTLVDSGELIYDILGGLIAKSRFKSLTPKDFEKIRGLPFSKKIKVILFFAKYQREFSKEVSKNISKIKFADGIKEMLSRLNEKGIEFSILSANTSQMITNFFELHGITVQSVYRSQRLFGKKRNIKKFIKQKRCKAGDVIYICDEIRDVEACNKCKVNVVFVNWGTDAGKDLTGYSLNLMAKTPAEVYNYLLTETKEE